MSVICTHRDNSVLVIVADNPPVNALSADLRAGIVEAVRQAEADDTVEAVVIIGAERTFFAGADISEFGKPKRVIGDEEIRERLLYPMVNEGAAILEEAMAQRASDIDIVWINGYGWPAWTGGPMFWADTIGLDTVVTGLEKHAARIDGLQISGLLRDKASKGEAFNG